MQFSYIFLVYLTVFLPVRGTYVALLCRIAFSFFKRSILERVTDCTAAVLPASRAQQQAAVLVGSCIDIKAQQRKDTWCPHDMIGFAICLEGQRVLDAADSSRQKSRSSSPTGTKSASTGSNCCCCLSVPSHQNLRCALPCTSKYEVLQVQNALTP